VARRRDADALAVLNQVGDQVSARPRAGTRRPLDDEVPPVERADERLQLVEV